MPLTREEIDALSAGGISESTIAALDLADAVPESVEPTKSAASFDMPMTLNQSAPSFTDELLSGWGIAKDIVSAPSKMIGGLGQTIGNIADQYEKDPSLAGEALGGIPNAVLRSMYEGVDTPLGVANRTGEIVSSMVPGGLTGYHYLTDDWTRGQQSDAEYGKELRGDLANWAVLGPLMLGKGKIVDPILDAKIPLAGESIILDAGPASAVRAAEADATMRNAFSKSQIDEKTRLVAPGATKEMNISRDLSGANLQDPSLADMQLTKSIVGRIADLTGSGAYPTAVEDAMTQAVPVAVKNGWFNAADSLDGMKLFVKDKLDSLFAEKRAAAGLAPDGSPLAGGVEEQAQRAAAEARDVALRSPEYQQKLTDAFAENFKRIRAEMPEGEGQAQLKAWDETVRQFEGKPLVRVPGTVTISDMEKAKNPATGRSYIHEFAQAVDDLKQSPLTRDMAEPLKATFEQLMSDVENSGNPAIGQTPGQVIRNLEDINLWRRKAGEFADGRLAGEIKGNMDGVATQMMFERSIKAVSDFQHMLTQTLDDVLSEVPGTTYKRGTLRDLSEQTQAIYGLDRGLQFGGRQANALFATKNLTAQPPEGINLPNMSISSFGATRAGVNPGLVKQVIQSVTGRNPAAGALAESAMAAQTNPISAARNLITLNSSDPFVMQSNTIRSLLGGGELPSPMSMAPYAQMAAQQGNRTPEPTPLAAPAGPAIAQGTIGNMPVIPKQGFMLPRDLNQVDPVGVAGLITGNLSPMEAQPLLNQWQNLVATGDRMQMAAFLGQLSQAYPKLPFAQGQVTGMMSEFDVGDGLPRLFSPTDQAAWEQQIDNSPLREDEKAIRVAALRKNYIAIPLDMKINTQLNISDPNMTPNLRQLFRTHQFQKRIQTSTGSRRVD